ncbi:MAG: msbA [Deltaproteobacteria bacterium]|nr:msbA [Deltaproteobacteria bacterium]
MRPMNRDSTQMTVPTDDGALHANRPAAATAGRSSGGAWLHELRLREWFHIMGARPFQLLTPALLSTCVAALEGVSVGLLVPIAVGVTKRDFSFVRNVSGFSVLARWFPGWFGPGGNDFAALFLLVACAIFVAAVVKNLLSYVAHVYSAYCYGQYLQRANDFVFDRYLGFGKLYFDRANQGTLQAVLGYTGELLDLLNFTQKGILNLLTLAAYLAVMLWISWPLTAFVLCFFPLIHYSIRWMSRRIERLSRQLNEATLTRHATAYNILSCIPLFKAYAQENEAKRTYGENNELLRRLNLRINAVQGLISPFQEIMTLVAMLAMIAVLAFYLSDREPAQMAVFLVFFFAARSAVPKFTTLYEIGATLAAKKPKLVELARLLDDREKFIVPDGAIEFTGLREGIETRNLDFAYSDEVAVLKGISVRFAKGAVTALVGPSGSGKSTLIHLLMGFYPVPPGSIYVDGRDLASLRMESLRRHIALVAQDVFLFSDTLRANIQIGTERPPADTELWGVLRKARLADFVGNLPEGLDTQVGDRGMKLSGGEKQRVAIARALLKRAEILILDEATSALDSETERLIQEAIDEAMADRTAIVIAHRLSTIRHADHIVFLEDGRAVEQGTLSELLERNARFAEFWRSQHFPPFSRANAE